MARYIYQGFTQDANGKIITSASITVYLGGTTSAATIYAADSGGVALTGGVVTSSATTGYFKFYADEANYQASTKFDLVQSKTGYTTTTLEDVIIPGLPESYPGLTDFSYEAVLADDETYSLPAMSSGGWGEVLLGNGTEFAIFTCTSAAAVTLRLNSTNVAASDSDGNLCIYDGGTQVVIKNRLGSSQTLLVKFHYVA
jgi:hypothetical protein